MWCRLPHCVGWTTTLWNVLSAIGWYFVQFNKQLLWMWCGCWASQAVANSGEFFAVQSKWTGPCCSWRTESNECSSDSFLCYVCLNSAFSFSVSLFIMYNGSRCCSQQNIEMHIPICSHKSPSETICSWRKGLKEMKTNKRMNKKKIKTKRNKGNSKYFDRNIIRTINNVFYSKQVVWLCCGLSF